jgi:hypothetical protein
MNEAAPGDEMLMAYVDGELDAEAAEAVAKAIASDGGLAARAEAFRLSRQAARAAFTDALTETPPDRLIEALRAPPPRTIQPAVARARPRLTRMAMLPMAAAILVAIGLGVVLVGSGLDRSRERGAAESAIAERLPSLMSGDEAAVTVSGRGAKLRTLGAYRVADGICRSFALTSAGAVRSGVGCDRGAGWSVEMMTVAAAPSDAFTAASDEAAAEMDTALDRLGAEGPLSAEEEAALVAALGGRS